MNDSIKVLLLQLINNKGSVENVINKGYTYSQLATFIKDLIQDEFVIAQEGTLNVTNLGLDELRRLNKKLKRFNTETWISPQDEFRVVGLSKYDIFIPRK